MSDNGKRDRSASVGRENPRKRPVSGLFRAILRCAWVIYAIVLCFCMSIYCRQREQQPEHLNRPSPNGDSNVVAGMSSHAEAS